MFTSPSCQLEGARIADLQSYHILDTACEESFDEIAGLAAQLIGCPMAAISLIGERRQWFKARFGLDTRETHESSRFVLTPSCKRNRSLSPMPRRMPALATIRWSRASL